jgi:TonB-linked SusC/RagA family outer membrane protein
LSGAYTEQEGIVVGDDFKRTSLRANFSNDINEWMTVGMKTSFAHKDYSGEQANLEMAVLASPLATVYANKETGELNLYPQTDQLVINPLSYTNAQDQEIYDNLFAILYTDIKIPKIEGLTFHFDYSNTLEFGKHNQFWGTNTVSGLLAPNGKASKDNSEERDWSINSILSYSRKFKEKHRIDATLLYTSEKRNAEASEMLASNFFTSVLKWDNMGIGKIQSNTSTAWQESSTGLMARVAYAFDQKYLVTATIRRDGFSGFSQNHKYADFPSLSVGWVASEESFLKNVDWLSFLKLRLSYGVNGNQALGRYGSLAQVGQVQYVYGDGGGTSVGIYPSTLANADLGWEKTKSINLGLNINVLKNRISTEFDFYTTKTNDLLVQQSLPEVSGYKSVWTNLGEIQNKGFEVTLNTVNITNQDLRWESKFTFSLNRNKIVHLYGVDNDGDGFEDSDIGNKWFIGKSLGAIYDYKINGIYQTGDTDIPSGFYPGYFKIKDTDGVDGITPDDRTIVGNTSPNYRFSIYNGLTYKNFSLSFLINSVQGGGKNNYYLGENSPSLNPNYSFPDRLNIPDINYWTPDNPTNTTPIINYKAKYFHGMYQDRSFVRLQDVTLAYTLKPSRFMGQSSLKIYVSGKNLYTWTKWTGWDPEAGTTAGGDYYQYSSGGNTGNPVMRSFIAGIIFGF